MTRLERVSGQLAQLCPQEAAPFQQGWQTAEEQYGAIRERVCQAAAVLEEAVPRYSQVSSRQGIGARRVPGISSQAREEETGAASQGQNLAQPLPPYPWAPVDARQTTVPPPTPHLPMPTLFYFQGTTKTQAAGKARPGHSLGLERTHQSQAEMLLESSCVCLR